MTIKGDQWRASMRGRGRSTPTRSRTKGPRGYQSAEDRKKERTPHDPNDRATQSERDRMYNIDRDWKERDSPKARAKSRGKSRR